MHERPYAYLRRWNFKMNTIHDRGSFIDEAVARARYAAHEEWFSVVERVPGLGGGVAVPAFVVEVMVAAPEFKVHRLHPSGATDRVSFFSNVGGRLFASSVIDYHYDAEPVKLAHIGHRTRRFQPDGTGTEIQRTSGSGEIDVRELEGLPVADRWLDVPEFGDWAPLLAEDEGQPAT